MRILIISDIHANLSALQAVLRAAGNVEIVWCLGDIVGYGPDPNECIGLVRQMPGLKCIVGNHDAAALKQLDTSSFNPDARSAIHWTQNMLTDQSREFLENLPETVLLDHVLLSHGSPRHPVWEYVLDKNTARINFDYFNTDYCFFGHTHLPVMYTMREGAAVVGMNIPSPGTSRELVRKTLINPGSVGQPRDRDPRAAYAIYRPDEGIWEYYRVVYDIRAVQERMSKAGLPQRHIQRLSEGW